MTIAAIVDGVRAAGIECEVIGDPDVVCTTATHDSRAVEAGALFACLRGDSFDGHAFATTAVDSGAAALLVDHRVATPPMIVQLVVADTRLAIGPAASVVFGHPSRGLGTVGITGTNGKTTTAQMVATILEGAGRPTGVVGTLHGPRTTPEAADLQATLAGFVDEGRTAAVMEVSSHALALHRVDGTEFDVVAFTNFGHDHLDLHETPEQYFRAKSRLFDPVFAPVAVIDVDDPHGRLLADAVNDKMRVIEVAGADLDNVVVSAGSHEYRWNGIGVSVPLGGDFNVANSHLALTIAVALGIDADAAVAGVAQLATVPGRFELVASPQAEQRGISVVVDYAHTPDGLEQLITSARRLVSDDRRVLAVFGCGGERDADKRPAMGRVAAELADLVVVTTDNPRREDPQRIIDDVTDGMVGMYRAEVRTELDRRAAIAEALASAGRGDIVVIAGKGHERTQDLGAVTIDFDDRDIVRDLLESEDPS